MSKQPSPYKRLKEKLTHSDKELHHSSERLRVALKNVAIAVAQTDADFRYTWLYNPQRILFPEDALGKNDDELFEEQDAEKLIRIKNELRKTGLPQEKQIELFSEKRARVFDINAEPLLDEKGIFSGLTLAAMDVTDYMQREQELISHKEKLQEVALELALIQGRERRRLAQTLHDQLGQYLALAKMEVGALSSEEDQTRRMAHQIDALNYIEQAIHETRELTFELSPPVLFNLGLEPAVEWLLEQKSQKYGFSFRLREGENLVPLSKDMRILLFQFCRELVHNIVKHARANMVEVTIARKGEQVALTFADDGVGFDAKSLVLREEEGFGLFSLRDRLEFIGGKMTIDSALGKGTKVQILAPLNT